MTYPTLQLETERQKQGYLRVAGIDEAGRGPLAGPVVAAACWMEPGVFFPAANDSKKLSEKSREVLYHEISTHPGVIWATGIISSEIIDHVNIYQATILAMLAAVNSLSIPPDYLLVDGLKLPHPTIPGDKIIKGDAISHVISCASILAKVTRDRIMVEMDKEYPEYGFKQHKGYGTELHLQNLNKHGITPHHRRSFAPCK